MDIMTNFKILVSMWLLIANSTVCVTFLKSFQEPIDWSFVLQFL